MPKRWKVRYRRTPIHLPFNPRKGICEVCGRRVGEGEISKTDLHHFFYAYPTSYVRKHPIKVLDNSVECCFTCHGVLDSFRKIMEKPKLSRKVIKVIPKKAFKQFLQSVEG